MKEGLTVRYLHSGVLDEVDWASRTVKQGPGVDSIVTGGLREDSTETSCSAITEFGSVVSV